MTYQEQIRMIVTFLYNETKCFATSSTYHIPYKKIESAYSLWVGTKTVQSDIREEFGKNHLDRIQALDFDDTKEEVIVMIWETNQRKKYTINDYKEFCNNALELPPLDEFNDGSIDEEEWYRTHKIHITVDNHDMELDYLADNVTEIYSVLKEIYEIEMEVRGIKDNKEDEDEEYPNATWKDILRLNIMRLVYDGKTIKWAIKYTISNFDSGSYKKCMETIYNHTWYNDDFEVNFFKLSSCGMGKLFDVKERKQAIKEMLCKKIELSEMISQDGAHEDKTVITDYSINPTGHLVGWHYGVDWDKNSEDNQYHIQNYIKEMMGK